MNKPRIVIIGAGSHFTLGLFGDFYRVNDLWGSELVLMDIDDERLNLMNKIIEKVVEKRKLDIKVRATSNLKEALENADFVIVTIRVGGLKALKEIIEIPLRLGTVEIVGDTVGPSGVLKGMLEIPAILNIAQNMKDVAPNALMINFTNPMTPICRSVRKSTDVRIIGLCHGFNQIRRLASNIPMHPSYSMEKLDVEAAGINHLTWTLDIRYGDKSVYEEFQKGLLEGSKETMAKYRYLIGRELYRVFKIPPTLNDRHTSEFFHYLYDWIDDPNYGPILKEESGYIDYENKTLRKEVIENEENRMQRLVRMADGLEEIDTVPSGEYAFDIISAMENDRKRDLLAVNMPNSGIINGIPSEHVVEVPAEVSKHGLRPIKNFQLPKAITSVLNRHLDKFETMVDGILEGDKDLIVQAIALDPLTPSPEKAEKIFDLFIKTAQLKAIKSRLSGDRYLLQKPRL
ncbi:MAG: hypothetical protein QW220_02295 [Candidatus Bathyarchaeia archaeon]